MTVEEFALTLLRGFGIWFLIGLALAICAALAMPAVRHPSDPRPAAEGLFEWGLMICLVTTLLATVTAVAWGLIELVTRF